MKKVVLFSLFLLGCISYSQNYITSLPFVIKKGRSFSYVDKSKDEGYLFISNSKKVRIAHYDNKFNYIDTIMTAIPDNKPDDMIGFTKNESSINLIWSSNSGKKFIFQNIDFTTKKTSSTIKDLDFDNQTVLQTFSSNDTFYYLTIQNQSSVLKLYCFSNTGELNVKTINAGSAVFTNSRNQRATIYDLLAEEFGSFESSFELQNIDVSIPNSIAICSKKRKAYLSDDNLVLTFDNNPVSTQLIKIALTDFKYECIKIDKPTGDVTTNTNSFLFEDTLYQIKASASKLSLSVKKIDGSTVKEFSANLNDAISFKSSDFICEWVNPETENNIVNTNQFINTLSDYSVGISCYSYNGKNLVSFGGVSKLIQKSSPDGKSHTIYYPFNTGAIGGLVASAAYLLFSGSNSLYYNYISSRNIISVNSLFSKDLELQTEKVNSYSCNKICHYFNGYSDIRLPTFFSTNKKAYLGYYNAESKQFVIMEFKN